MLLKARGHTFIVRVREHLMMLNRLLCPKILYLSAWPSTYRNIKSSFYLETVRVHMIR